jgi:hypothetical protein
MVTMQVTREFLQMLFDVIEGVAITPSLWQFDLFTGNPALGINTVIGDLTVPTFAGYAGVVVAVPALEINANGDYLITWPTALFQASGAVSPAQTATGVFLSATVSASPKLLAAGYLATPKTFNGATDAVSVVIQTILPNALIYGGIAAQV